MAYQRIENVKIAGISASVPDYSEENSALNLFKENGEYEKFVASTGVERRRRAMLGLCASDLCLAAAEELVKTLEWKKDDIECLIFASHSPDYLFPATSCIIQDRLGLSTDCMSFDISLGCSGWVYGISVLASLVSAGKFKKALLLAGDTTTRSKSPKDKGTYPLFGDSGSATALEYDKGAADILSHMGTDGKNYNAIIKPDGGSRNPVSFNSLSEVEHEDGNISNRLHTHMDGMTVFSFGITKVPKSIQNFLTHFELDKKEIDYLVLHQANKMINERIQKKLGFPDEKVPTVFRDFGNTSSGSIPLAMAVNLKDQINNTVSKKLNILACGFGVGLSWGSLFFELSDAVCTDLIEVKNVS